jgi:ABC-type multidrug transport system fused ATPase/permease subunit
MSRTHHVHERKEATELALMDAVGDTVQNYRIICDYYRRPKATSYIEQLAKTYNEAAMNVMAVRVNNEWCAKWISVGILCCLIVLGGTLVADEAMQLGNFFALIRVASITGGKIANGYVAYFTMYDAFLPLWRIVRFMNIHTDLAKRKAANRVRRKRGEEMRKKVRQNMTKDDFKKGPPVDRIPIMVENVSFTFNPKEPSLLQDITQTFKQGQMYGIMGPPAAGKGVLLEFIGSVYEVSSGNIFVPPHLRVLHVSKATQVLAGSVIDNLFFGILPLGQTAADLDYATLERGWRICERLRFPARLMRLARRFNTDDEEGGANVFGEESLQGSPQRTPSPQKSPTSERTSGGLERSTTSNLERKKTITEDDGRLKTETTFLSRSDRKLIHLARALIYNPEVIVIHTPGMYFDRDMKTTILEAMKDFVKERGLEMDPTTKSIRRPRTCIFSTYDSADALYADKMFTCEDGKLKCSDDLYTVMGHLGMGDADGAMESNGSQDPAANM